MKQNPHIRDVASAAGVSHSTVSRVIRDAYGVSEEMRERVHQAIAALGYRPSVAARSMRGASYTIGMAMPAFTSEFFMEIFAGAQGVLDRTQYRLLSIVSGTEEVRDRSPSVQALVDRQVDALIIIAPLVDAEWLEDVAGSLPVVVIGRHDGSDHYDTVGGDDRVGAELAVDHLRELGHSRILHVTQFDSTDRQVPGTPHLIRREAFLRRMDALGLGSHAPVLGSGYNYEAAHTSTVRYFTDRPDGVTAVFAGADEAAFGVLRAITELGIDHRVAVVGYDNSRFADHPRISLSSIDQSGREQGVLAAQLLLERLGGRKTPRHELLEPSLVVRQSSENYRPRGPLPASSR